MPRAGTKCLIPIGFEYMIPDGQTVEAWVATCNLICYDKLQNNHMALLEDD